MTEISHTINKILQWKICLHAPRRKRIANAIHSGKLSASLNS